MFFGKVRLISNDIPKSQVRRIRVGEGARNAISVQMRGLRVQDSKFLESHSQPPDELRVERGRKWKVEFPGIETVGGCIRRGRNEEGATGIRSMTIRGVGIETCPGQARKKWS